MVRMSKTQLVLIVVLIVALLFVLFKCKLKCGVNTEGWSDQVRDQVSNPYFADIFSNCGRSLGAPRKVPCSLSDGSWDRSEPLTERANKITYFKQGEEDARAAQMLAMAP